MTHPTDEELDALVKWLDELPCCHDGPHETSARCKSCEKTAADAITALRAQLAEANARADRAEAALAAQSEADAKPAMRLSIARKIGMYGSAYDGPFDARAYTYDHQPGNQAAWAIGRAASNATLDKVGDYIDRGLGLLRHLKAEGFGVFALNNNDTHDHTAPDRIIADLLAERDDLPAKLADATKVPRIITFHTAGKFGVCIGGRWDGWVMMQHPDGYWVSHHKPDPVDPSIPTLRAIGEGE